jgi:hypothetical protein
MRRFTVDQCLIPSIQVWEEPEAWRKDRVGPKHQRDTSNDFGHCVRHGREQTICFSQRINSVS